ncbi:MAG: transglutaminase domain-containing protein [Candidatus Altiarchaeota archaeon]
MSSFASSEFQCSDYPDEGIIILLDQIENNITYSKYQKSSDLPDGWEIISQSEISDEEFKDYLLDSSILSSADYKKGEFLGAHRQTIRSDTGEKFYVRVETFSDYNAMRKIYNQLYDVYDRARNIQKFEGLGDQGISGFVAQWAGDKDQQAIFYRGSLLYNIFTEEHPNARSELITLAKSYSSTRKSLNYIQNFNWRVMICESQTPLCTQRIGFNPSAETYELLKCSTTENGRKIKCPDERIDKFLNFIEIPFASCEKGNILEYEIEKYTEFPIPNRFWSVDDFYFRRIYPAEKLKLVLNLPKDMDILDYSTGSIEPITYERGDDKTYMWEKTGSEPYEYESFMPSRRELLLRTSYTSLKSWQEVEEWVEGLFEGAIDQVASVSKVKEIVGSSDSDEEKIRKIFEWVRDNIRYEDAEIGFNTGYRPHDAKKVLDYKFGDCKDQSILLTSMLRAAGIKAYPVLVGRDPLNKNVPSPFEFYHAIVAVPKGGNEYLWLDSTCSSCPVGYIPPSDQGSDVLILLDEKDGFTKTPEMESDKNRISETNYFVKVKDNGSAEIEIDFSRMGYEAAYLNHEFEEDSSKDDLKDEFGSEINVICNDYEISNYDIGESENKETFQVKIRVDCKDFATKSDDKLAFKIKQYGFFSSVIDDDEREFPIEIDYNERYDTTTQITIPEDYKVGLLPDPVAKSEDFASYEFTPTQADGKISFSTKITINQITVPPEKFPQFKKFFTEMNGIENIVVLQPKSSTEEIKAEDVKIGESSSVPAEITSSIDTNEPVKGEQGGNNGLLIIIGAVVVFVLIVGAFLLGKKH